MNTAIILCYTTDTGDNWMVFAEEVNGQTPLQQAETKLAELNTTHDLSTWSIGSIIKSSEWYTTSTGEDDASQEDNEGIAQAFSAILQRWLEPDHWYELIERTKAETDKDVCHSHDYCDANMAMLEAFKEVTGREFCFYNDDEPLSQNQFEQDTDTVNKAWNIAKANLFYIPTTTQQQ